MTMMVNIIDEMSVKIAIRSWLKSNNRLNVMNIVFNDKLGSCEIYSNSTGNIYGLPFLKLIYEEIGCEIQILVEEGSTIGQKTKIAIVKGKINDIYSGEKLCRRILSKASCIGHRASEIKKVLTSKNWKGKLIFPDDLTPGFEVVEEYSLLANGFLPVMLPMIPNGCASSVGSIDVWFECESFKEAKEAAGCGSKRISLNLEASSFPSLRENIAKLRIEYKDLKFKVNAPVTEKNASQLAMDILDEISCSNILHNTDAMYFSFEYSSGNLSPKESPKQIKLEEGEKVVEDKSRIIGQKEKPVSASLPSPQPTKKLRSDNDTDKPPLKSPVNRNNANSDKSKEKKEIQNNNGSKQPNRNVRNKAGNNAVNKGPYGQRSSTNYNASPNVGHYAERFSYQRPGNNYNEMQIPSSAQIYVPPRGRVAEHGAYTFEGHPVENSRNRGCCYASISRNMKFCAQCRSPLC